MAMKINLKVPTIPVQNADVEFEVWRDGKKVGRVKISKGGLDWYKASAQKLTGRATWSQFQEWMESEG